MIHPSPALLVRADTPIQDCIAIMKTKNVGSILVASDDAQSRLVGIFTERDLLRKTAVINRWNTWNRPIRTVMTSPVKTLDLGSIEQAPALLLEHGFRHLPITTTENGVERLVGVVSMRDFFRQWAAQKMRKPWKRSGEGAPPIVHVWSKDDQFVALLQRALPLLAKPRAIRVQGVVPGAPIEGLGGYLLIDLDGTDKKLASEISELIGRANGKCETALIFDSAHSNREVSSILEKNSESSTLFTKPLNLVAISEFLNSGSNPDAA
ncbi:MAG: CBS domain-containing protein [Bdellovibrionota bacterium]